MCLIPWQCFKSVRQTAQENSSFITTRIQEERSIFWEIRVSVIVIYKIHKNVYLSDYQDIAVGIYKYKRTVNGNNDKLLLIVF